MIFGLPTSYENDHERAIEASGELQSHFSSLRIGISTGDLLIQSDVRLDYRQMELTTEACNLARNAEPGKTLINPRLYSLVENILRCKLKQQPTGYQCYEIIGISEKLKQKLKPKLSRESTKSNGHSRLTDLKQSKSIRKHKKNQKLKRSRAKFLRNFKELTNQSFGCIYYLLIVIAIVVSVLAILMLGC